MYFYDTCALINDQEVAFREPFVIADVTLYELEEIKTSRAKDEELKVRVRKLLHLLNENLDKYTVAYSPEDVHFSQDERIIMAAKMQIPQLPFRTDDLACAFIARSHGLEVVTKSGDEDNYLGFKKLHFETEDDTVEFYSHMTEGNLYDLETNQYLLIYVKDTLIDKLRWDGEKYIPVGYPCYESKALGKIGPKDEYQAIALDSMKNNQLTVLRGPAGTGKSYLSMGFLMNRLEKGAIDKIIVFCNTVATAGAARLGFYPGSRDEKLLDSQIGNFLASKLGGMEGVRNMIESERLVLLPMSDIRGFDTTGMHAGIYITEAQNMDIELMRLALQRIGEDSICVIEGDDDAQVDMAMYAGARNGMKRMSKVFRGQDFYGEVSLQNIHRSRIANIAQKM